MVRSQIPKTYYLVGCPLASVHFTRCIVLYRCAITHRVTQLHDMRMCHVDFISVILVFDFIDRCVCTCVHISARRVQMYMQMYIGERLVHNRRMVRFPFWYISRVLGLRQQAELLQSTITPPPTLPGAPHHFSTECPLNPPSRRQERCW